MTTEEFAAIDRLSTLARVAMEDFKSLPRKDFYPHHARFVSTTDHFNRFSPGNSELPDGHCAVCLAGAVLVGTLRLPMPSADVRDAFGNPKTIAFSDDPEVDLAVKNRILAIENMRVNEFHLALIRLFPDRFPDYFPITTKRCLETRFASFIGWTDAEAFLVDWQAMIEELETRGF